jgi:protoheme IX farnesyltransferase
MATSHRALRPKEFIKARLGAGLITRLRAYWALIKSLQTGLLLFTGLAGYLSAVPRPVNWPQAWALTGSVLLTIAGSTVLNMVYDRDIDGMMKRTAHRPLPAGKLGWQEALLFGSVLSVGGIGWALWLDPLYGLIVFSGLVVDVLIYTIWLKRRTAWSVVWGGLAGGMPVLAGRVLAVGEVDLVGIMLALAILLWIPTHIMTFAIKHAGDYARAGVPVFPNTFGERTTRQIIAGSTVLAAVVISTSAWLIGLPWVWLHSTVALGAILIGLALAATFYPSSKLNFALFKFASVYMLTAMSLLVLGAG